MSLSDQLLVISLAFILAFLSIRGFIGGLILYRIRARTYTKKKRGQTLKEWFFYSRFKELIPKFFLVIYYAVIIIHLLAAIICVMFYFIKLEVPMAKIIFYFDFIWISVLCLFFWSPKEHLKYERWISKDWKKKR